MYGIFILCFPRDITCRALLGFKFEIINNRRLNIKLLTIITLSAHLLFFSDPEVSPGMSDVTLVSGISGLSFDSPFLSPLLFFFLLSPLALSVL